jgi:acyl-CoA synthetase (AMP-forming)/AMP-acid ligase II
LWLGDETSIAALKPLAPAGVTLATWGDAQSDDGKPRESVSHGEFPAWLLYTSGTTGKSKGVPLSDANLIAAAANAGIARNFSDSEVLGLPFPLFHIAATNLLMAHLHARPVVLIKGFEPQVVSELIARHQITALSLAPTMIRRLVDFQQVTPTDLSTLKTIYYGAAPITPSLLSQASHVLGCAFSQGYGMTEAAGNAVFLDGDAHAKGLSSDETLLSKAGIAGAMTILRVVDDQGLDVPPGELGEITLAGPQVFSNYEPEEGVSEAAFDVYGGFRTGDLGTLTPDGLLQVVDRKKDIIITGGENVSSLEVESALSAHEMIHAVAVVGRPHPEWGEEIVAVVVPSADFDEGAVKSFAREHLSGFKRPKAYVLVEALAVNATGKIDKRALRQLVTSSNS